MDMPDTIERLIAVGRTDLAERLKHLAGNHNQSRHGWRFAKGGDDAAKLGAARRSMRGRDAGERAEYRKRAGMPKAEQRGTSVYDRAAAQYELRGNRPNTVSAARATARHAAAGDAGAEVELLGFGKDALRKLTDEETHRGTRLGDYLRRKLTRDSGVSDAPTQPEPDFDGLMKKHHNTLSRGRSIEYPSRDGRRVHASIETDPIAGKTFVIRDSDGRKLSERFYRSNEVDGFLYDLIEEGYIQ